MRLNFSKILGGVQATVSAIDMAERFIAPGPTAGPAKHAAVASQVKAAIDFAEVVTGRDLADQTMVSEGIDELVNAVHKIMKGGGVLAH